MWKVAKALILLPFLSLGVGAAGWGVYKYYPELQRLPILSDDHVVLRILDLNHSSNAWLGRYYSFTNEGYCHITHMSGITIKDLARTGETRILNLGEDQVDTLVDMSRLLQVGKFDKEHYVVFSLGDNKDQFQPAQTSQPLCDVLMRTIERFTISQMAKAKH